MMTGLSNPINAADREESAEVALLKRAGNKQK